MNGATVGFVLLAATFDDPENARTILLAAAALVLLGVRQRRGLTALVGQAARLGEQLDARLVTQLIYATSVSWMAGFVVVGVPGGIGVRETVFLSLMTAPLGSGVAVSVAVLSRVVSIVVDLAGAGLSIPISRTAPPIAPMMAPCGPGEPDTPSSYAAP